MGNSLSHQDSDKMAPMFNLIMDTVCPELDIGDRRGSTGYIDFIEQKETHGSMMKGVDVCGRQFIVWKAMVMIENPNGKNIIYPTFTTFFNRYSDTTSPIYHTCGHHGRNLFNTEGGISLQQMEFLHKLLSTGSAELALERANELRFSYPYFNCDENVINKNGWIFKITLVDNLEDLEPL